ncbi:MAG: hypothetical protein K0R28_11 [Paenibacillus sp.]|jgi:hypothetical protein|nr:hypothetical protein [Paenibacillus sp.]
MEEIKESVDERRTMPDQISRRHLLAAFGIAGAAVATHSLLGAGSGFTSGQQSDSYGAGGNVNQAVYGESGSGDAACCHRMYTSTLDMKADTALTASMFASTAGYYAAGDGGHGLYLIQASMSTEDGGSVITLDNGLQALLLPDNGLNYKQFGAIGDGTNDDGVAIKHAHVFANIRGLPIRNPSGNYWIKETNNIPIMTDVYWGHTVFHLDEAYNSETTYRFHILSEHARFTIELEPSVKASLVSKLKPGTTLIEELAPYKNCLIGVWDTGDQVGARYGYPSQTGMSKEDFFYVEEHGALIGEIAWTFSNYTHLLACPCDDSYLTVDGGTFVVSGNSPGTGAYRKNGFVITRSRTIIRNQWVGLANGAVDTALSPRNGFYTYNRVYDVQLENIRLIPWEQNRPGTAQDVPSGTYGIAGDRVLRAVFRNITAEGSQVHWGVFGTNFFKQIRVDHCRLNRFDVHFFCWDLHVSDTEFGQFGMTLTGGGDLFVDNTTVFGNRFIQFRNDYGSRWDGDIRIRNCRLVVADGMAESMFLFYNTANFNYKYSLGYGRTIQVENIVIDYTNTANPDGISTLMKTATLSRTSSGDRLQFPVRLEFRNVTVVGREKGVRLMRIFFPGTFYVAKAGGYDGKQVTANCTIRFENIDCEKAVAQPVNPNSFVVFLLSAAHTAGYVDAHALYPRIDIVNCGEFYGHFRGAIADIYINRCNVNVMLNNDAGPLRGKLVLDNCTLQATAVDDNSPLYSLGSVLGTTFQNCTVHAPVLDGISRPDALSRYDFISINESLRHTHIQTRLSEELMDYLTTSGMGVASEFVSMLKSRHEAEPTVMITRKGTTPERPLPAAFLSEKGTTFFDTDENESLVWNGAQWTPAARRGETFGYYSDDISAASPGSPMHRSGSGAVQHYVMPFGGKLRHALVHVSAPSSSPSFTFEIMKNGAVWIGGLAGSTSSSNPLVVALAGPLTYAQGDRLSIRIGGIDPGLAANTFATVDLYALHETAP